MADNEHPKKSSPFVEGLKQKLTDELLAGSDKARKADGSIDTEKLRGEQLGILKKYGKRIRAAAGIFTKLGADLSATQDFFAKGGARTLDELLVSKEAWPFRDILELSDRFGPLPKGYSYRYLVPETRIVPKKVADVANNVIKLPSALNLAVKKHLDRPGDEISDRSLAEWLDGRPAELVRLWTLRILSLFRVLKATEVPAGKRSIGDVPAAGARHVAGSANSSPEIATLINEFREAAMFQYDGEEKGDDVSIRSGVLEKKNILKKLNAFGSDAVLELRSLLSDPDIGVRASAGTYLLPMASEIALPVLLNIAAHWHECGNEDRGYCANNHAKQTLWMYEDGNLQLGLESSEDA
jgi:hypothetical protein